MKKNWFKFNWQSGSSLIEIVIATGVMALVLTAIVAALTLSLKTTSESRYRSQAVKRAQESMEVFRRERTLLGWDNFLSSMQASATFCLATLPEPRASFTAGSCGAGDTLVISGYDFYRGAEVAIDLGDPNDPQVIVTVTIDWTMDGQPRDVEVIQSFRKY